MKYAMNEILNLYVMYWFLSKKNLSDIILHRIAYRPISYDLYASNEKFNEWMMELSEMVDPKMTFAQGCCWSNENLQMHYLNALFISTI